MSDFLVLSSPPFPHSTLLPHILPSSPFLRRSSFSNQLLQQRKVISALSRIPQDIFRVIFQYLSVEDLIKGEEAFLNNQDLLSLYQSSLEGFTLKEEITIKGRSEELLHWIIDRKLLVEKLQLLYLRELEIDLLNRIRFSLKSIAFHDIVLYSENSSFELSQLGHFPSLTSVEIHESNCFTNEDLMSFFSLHPQLEIVDLNNTSELSNEIILPLAESCPNIKILLLYENKWVNEETISLLTPVFPNLKSLDISDTRVDYDESLQQFILSHPHLCGIILPAYASFLTDFLLLLLKQVIIPSILNYTDLESHSLAIASLGSCIDWMADEMSEMITPELFTLDLLNSLYHKDYQLRTLPEMAHIVNQLSTFPSMDDSIKESQFLSILLDSMTPYGLPPDHDSLHLLFKYYGFSNLFPVLLKKYEFQPSSLIEIYLHAIEFHISLLSNKHFENMIPTVLSELRNPHSSSNCLNILTTLLELPIIKSKLDPTALLSSLKVALKFSNLSHPKLILCFQYFLSIHQSYQQLFINSQILQHFYQQTTKTKIMTSFLSFLSFCLDPSPAFTKSSSRSLPPLNPLIDSVMELQIFQDLLNKFTKFEFEISRIFKLLIKYQENKYSERVREMQLPEELRVKLFPPEKKKETKKKKATQTTTTTTT